MSGLHLIWFRRDLRVHDNAALNAAIQAGQPVLPLYIIEPDIWEQTGRPAQQFSFIIESLKELDLAIKDRGGQLCLRVGNAAGILAKLHTDYGISTIHMHADHGPLLSEQCDTAIANWARRAGIALRIHDQYGSLQQDDEPDLWAAHWQASMTSPRLIAPEMIETIEAESDAWPSLAGFGRHDRPHPDRPRGGRSHAVECLQQLLKHPLGVASSSDDIETVLSPHLAFGTLSVREAWQGAHMAQARQSQQARAPFMAPDTSPALDRLTHFLREHCKLMQAAHHLARNAALNLSQHADSQQPHLAVWLEGRTGFPFLDACMRMAMQTGHLDPARRNWVIQFAARYLHIPPARIARALGHVLIDYQDRPFEILCTRLARTTGRTSLRDRVMDFPKQTDPDGIFVRRWVPELSGLPTAFIHEPWCAPQEVLVKAGLIMGQAYPMRIVDHWAASHLAYSKPYTGLASPPRRLAKTAKHLPKRSGDNSLRHHRKTQLSLDLDLQDSRSSRAL